MKLDATTLALLPLALLGLVCFLKFSVVLALLARALGGRVLPAVVTAGVAILLAGFVLAPVAEKATTEPSTEPVRAFLEAHTPTEARSALLESQRNLRPSAERERVTEHDLVVLLPAFAVSELKAAFRVGFFLLLPFLVIDLFLAVVLLGVGMRLDPRVVALPLKLLLFIAIDGWGLIIHGLVNSYT